MSLKNYDDGETRKVVFLGMKWTTVLTLFVVLLVLAVGALVWALSVGTSDIKGRGDAVRQRNSGTNRVFAQQHFEDLNAAIERDQANIRVSREALQADKSNPVKQANVTGAQQICNADVADYNASARKYLERDFKAADLPSRVELAVCE